MHGIGRYMVPQEIPQSPGTAPPSQRSLHRSPRRVTSASHLRHHHVSSLTGHAQSKHRTTRKLTAFTARRDTAFQRGPKSCTSELRKVTPPADVYPRAWTSASGGPLETARVLVRVPHCTCSGGPLETARVLVRVQTARGAVARATLHARVVTGEAAHGAEVPLRQPAGSGRG